MRRRGDRTGCRLSRTLALLPAIVLAGCDVRAPVPADVAVTIEGEEVVYHEFEDYLRLNVGRDPSLSNEVLSRLFDQFLDERLLDRLAIDTGFPAAGDPATGYPAPAGTPPRRREAVAWLVERVGRRSWDEDAVAAYYEAHRESFQKKEAVNLRQILAYDRQKAEEARKALDAGEGFAVVAERFSEVPMMGLSGEDGRLTRGDLPEAFADAIFELEPGEPSEVFAADYGFHIFQVVERFPAADVPLEEVAGEIRRILEREHADEVVASLVAEARGRYNVRVHKKNVPFDYRGSYADDES